MPYILYPYDIVDINTAGDWKLAETIARRLGATDDESSADVTPNLVPSRFKVRG
jgi:hypothetical protein